jgi:DNA repair exonuclease SbcCD ATPase subunit
MQQSHSLDFKLVQRVCLLQQALDQALESLDELTAQVQDKYWIETQLASTEKYANVQQQAINHLKQQLTQFTEIQDHLLGVMGFRLNELIDQQQQGFDQLNLQFQQSHTELQTYLQYLTQQQQTGSLAAQDTSAHYRALEEEVMVARSMAVHLSQYLGLAKQHLGQLNAELANHHLNLGQIIQTIQAMIAELGKFDQHATTRAAPSSTSPPAVAQVTEARSPVALHTPETPDVATLQATVRRQAARIRELHETLAAHVDQETRLRQQCQKVAAERDYYCRQLQQQSAPLAVELELLRSAPGSSSPQSQGEIRSPMRSPHRPRSRPSQPIQPLQLPEES